MNQTSIPQNIVTKNSSIRSSPAPCQSGLICIVQESKRAKLESHKKKPEAEQVAQEPEPKQRKIHKSKIG